MFSILVSPGSRPAGRSPHRRRPADRPGLAAGRVGQSRSAVHRTDPSWIGDSCSANTGNTIGSNTRNKCGGNTGYGCTGRTGSTSCSNTRDAAAGYTAPIPQDQRQHQHDGPGKAGDRNRGPVRCRTGDRAPPYRRTDVRAPGHANPRGRLAPATPSRPGRMGGPIDQRRSGDRSSPTRRNRISQHPEIKPSDTADSGTYQ